jgi:hypothetical protein
VFSLLRLHSSYAFCVWFNVYLLRLFALIWNFKRIQLLRACTHVWKTRNWNAALSLSNQELRARDKLSAFIENCNGKLESHDENRTSAWENMVSSQKTIDRRFLQLRQNHAWKHPKTKFYKAQATITSWLRIRVFTDCTNYRVTYTMTIWSINANLTVCLVLHTTIWLRIRVPLKNRATVPLTQWKFNTLMLSHCMPRSYLYHHGILINLLIYWE